MWNRCGRPPWQDRAISNDIVNWSEKGQPSVLTGKFRRPNRPASWQASDCRGLPATSKVAQYLGCPTVRQTELHVPSRLRQAVPRMVL